MKRTDLKKILIIGSGPIVIGQAAEFDYAGTQACLSLREEGYEVILVNSNPATIMTDTSVADKVYMEPLTGEYVADILRRERPDAILPGIGGQTGLNIAMQLWKKGVLEKCNVELLGTSAESIERAENRALFKEFCRSIGEPVIPSETARTLDEAREAAERIGYPVVLRPSFTLGGTGGGFAGSEAELSELAANAFALSPVHQLLVEKSVRGYKEIELEVMRDSADTVITVCGMENVDPVGVHTGDSIVVAPILSLSDAERRMLSDSAAKLIRELKIEGGCNVQFALDPDSGRYYLIEVNPRVSRSSALASKASGYPIASVTAKIAVGMTLDEIRVADGSAAREPKPDYIVAKLPRFPFDKFGTVPNTLGIQMKATGEVMGIGSCLEECLLKAVRSLETGVCHLYSKKFDAYTREELLDYISEFHDDNIYATAQLLRMGESVGKLYEVTRITELFLEAVQKIVTMEKTLAANIGDGTILRQAKKMGFSDRYISELWNIPETEIYNFRKEKGIAPAFRTADAMHGGKYIPYFYSSYEGKNESRLSDRKKIVVLGAGPIRVGQGIEFDYSTVHAVQTIRRAGYEAIIINNNPETVSTDYTTADKLYFDPLTPEDVTEIIDFEKPFGVVASLGGQTALNLAKPLAERGIKIIGTDCAAIERAEDRESFESLLKALGIPQPRGRAVTNIEDGAAAAKEIGYPVLVRPSFVLGGRAMEIAANEEALCNYLEAAVGINADRSVLVDHYIRGKEVEVDAVCDGQDVFVPGIMELVERSGVHSGDSVSVYPPYSLSDSVKKTILRYTKMLGLGIGIRGLFNVQFIVDGQDKVYVIEVNPRSSRTVPFISKATGCSLSDIAAGVILGRTLEEQGISGIYPEEKKRNYVKVPVFSSRKIKGSDVYLSPEMKSTGEVMGCGSTLSHAMFKALLASGMRLQSSGTVIVSLADEDKEEAFPTVRRFYNMGFHIAATDGTADFLMERGIKVRRLGRISEGSGEIPELICSGAVSYVVNTRSLTSGKHGRDGSAIRRLATENGVPVFTSLDTVNMVLEVLEDMPAFDTDEETCYFKQTLPINPLT